MTMPKASWAIVAAALSGVVCAQTPSGLALPVAPVANAKTETAPVSVSANDIAAKIAAAAAKPPTQLAPAIPATSAPHPVQSTERAPAITAGAPSVTKARDGTRTFVSRVQPAVAEAEALAAAEAPMPAFRPIDVRAAGAPGLVDQLKDPVPAWAKQALDRTAGKTLIQVSPGVTEIVRVARNFPNRFVTPFEAAEVVTTDESLLHDGVGGAVVVATPSDRPIGIFIQDKFSDRAIGLTLIPEDIPQREIRLVLDDAWGPAVLRGKEVEAADQGLHQSPYVDFVKQTMKSLAKGEVPPGHAMAPLKAELVPRCEIPGVTMRLGQILEGVRDRVGVYIARNDSNQPVTIQEAGCYRKGVLAVSAYPRPTLEPGQATELYVLLRKDAIDNAMSAKRRPVLVESE